MPDPSSPPPNSNLQALRRRLAEDRASTEKAFQLKAAADKLNQRISNFEARLGAMPGRVETMHFGKHPDDDGRGLLELGLRLHRSGKSWAVSYATYHSDYNEHPDHPMEWKPLSEAPLRLKIAAVSLFPSFLVSIEKAQDALIGEIETACRGYDAFIANVGFGTEGR